MIVSIAGTIRGSVAFALILTIENHDESPEIYIVKSSVLIMVFITTILLGAGMPSIITKLLSFDKPKPTVDTTESLLEEIEKEELEEEKKKKWPFFKKLDELYMKPCFIYDYHNRKDEIK